MSHIRYHHLWDRILGSIVSSNTPIRIIHGQITFLYVSTIAEGIIHYWSNIDLSGCIFIFCQLCWIYSCKD